MMERGTEKNSARVEREGIVIGAHAGVTRIRLEQAATCAGCGSRGTCSSASGKPQIVEVRLPQPTSFGERVTLALPESSIALAALLGYLFPAVTLLVGAVIAAGVFGNDGAAVLGAVCGLLVGLFCVRLVSGGFGSRHMTPDICSSTHSFGETP